MLGATSIQPHRVGIQAKPAVKFAAQPLGYEQLKALKAELAQRIPPQHLGQLGIGSPPGKPPAITLKYTSVGARNLAMSYLQSHHIVRIRGGSYFYKEAPVVFETTAPARKRSLGELIASLLKKLGSMLRGAKRD